MAGIVLAGGQSRRMGRDKLLLPLHGVPVLQRVLDVVDAVADQTIVVGRQYSGYRCVEDRRPGDGPLGGLVSGLLASEHDIALVVAADLPFLNGDLLRRLIDLVGSHDAAVPHVAGRAQPLYAAYRRVVVAVGDQLLATGDRRLTGFVERLDVRWVHVDEISHLDPELRSFTNINTATDWSKAQQSAR